MIKTGVRLVALVGISELAMDFGVRLCKAEAAARQLSFFSTLRFFYLWNSEEIQDIDDRHCSFASNGCVRSGEVLLSLVDWTHRTRSMDA